MARVEEFSISAFSGLNQSVNPYEMQDEDLSVAFNTWRLDLDGPTGTRPGTILEPDADYDASISGNPKICGLFDFRRTRDASRDLVAVIPGVAHTSDTVTLDNTGPSVTLTNGSGLPWSFAVLKGSVADHAGLGGVIKMYVAGGSSTDDFWRWDGDTSAAPDIFPVAMKNLTPATVTPRFVFELWNRLFAGGFNDSGGTDDATANPGLFRYSALNDGDIWPTASTIGGNFSIGGFQADSEEYTTGINEYSEADKRLGIFFTNKRLYVVAERGDFLAPFEVVREIENGCINHHCFVSLGVDSGDRIYMSESGIHSLRQSLQFGASEDTFLSWKIRNFFKPPTSGGINFGRKEYIVGDYLRSEGLVVFAVPTSTNTTNDTILALDVKRAKGGLNSRNAEWHVWKLSGTGADVGTFTVGRDASNNPRLYIGNENGDVVVLDPETYSDLGSAYSVNMRTKSYDFGTRTHEKILGDLYIDLYPGGDYQPTFRPVFDFDTAPGTATALDMSVPASGSVWLAGSWTAADAWSATQTMRIVGDKVYGLGGHRVIAFDFTHSGANEQFFVASIAAEVNVMGKGQKS